MPILVLTGDLSADARRRALSLGARDFLSKPLDDVELLLRVHNLLETHHLQQQLENQNEALSQRVAERTQELERVSRTACVCSGSSCTPRSRSAIASPAASTTTRYKRLPP